MLRKTLLAFTVAAALTACNKEARDKPGAALAQSSQKDGKAGAPVELLVAPEDLLTVRSKALASGPVITGSIEPERRADLRAEVSAVVLQVFKENGEAVRRGDVLLKLDQTSIRDSLTSAEEAVSAARQSLDQATRQVERVKTLRSSGMMSAQAFDDAEMRRHNAQSELAAARTRAVQAHQQLARTVVRAPFDGVVSERKVSNGDTAAVGKELLKVIDPASMRFEGRVSTDRISSVKVGQPVRFRINGYHEQQFEGVVRRIDPAANAITRQVEVLVGFANGAQPRVAGLYAEGRIDAETADALMLPESALVKAGDKTYTWRLKGNTLSKVDLVVGMRDQRSGNIEIRRGLAPGDMVLRNPGSNLKDGQPVQLANARMASAAVRLPPQGK